MKRCKYSYALTLVLVLTMSLSLLQVTAISTVSELDQQDLYVEIVFHSDIHDYVQILDFMDSRDGRGQQCEETLATQRLYEAGFSQNFIDNFSVESIEILSSSQRAFITTSHFAEEYCDKTDSYELVLVSRDEFLRLSTNEKEHELPILLEEYGGYTSGIDPFGVVVENRGGGTVVLMTALFHSPTEQHPGRYIALTEFLWTQMPSSRRTDFLGLGRGNGYAVLGNNFSGWLGHYTQRHSFWVQGGVVRTAPSEEPIFGTQAITTNELRPSEGVAIRANVPFDVLPSSIFPNQILFGDFRFGFQGGVSYTGTLTHIQNGTFHFNHYSVYMHQTGVSIGSPSISLSLSGPSISFSVSPSASYASAVNNVLTTTWIITTT